MPSLATSPRTVHHAIKRFEKEVRSSAGLAGRLAYARSWYACRDANGRWRFGPSKFVGYESLTAQQYLDLSRKGMDGRQTEARLRQWCREVDPSTELHEQLSSRLSAFLAEFDKAPSRKMRISVFLEDYDELVNDEHYASRPTIVDLIVAVAESLSPAELDLLRRRLTTISG